MVTPTNHVIAVAGFTFAGPQVLFRKHRNIFLPNVGEDQKKSYHLNAGPLAQYDVVNPALVYYVHKKVKRGPKVATFKQKPLISPGLYI